MTESSQENKPTLTENKGLNKNKQKKPKKYKEQIGKYGVYKLKGSHKTIRYKQMMVQAMEETLGHIDAATKKVGIGRVTHYLWLKDPEYKRMVSDRMESLKDDYEHALHTKALKEKDTKAITFFLRNKAKDRGYLETSKQINQVTGQIDNKIQLEIIEVQKKEDEDPNDNSVQEH